MSTSSTTPLRCAIIDDEPLALDLLESYIKRTPFLVLVGRYSNALQALEGLANHHADLIFCDIQMPELDGIRLSKMLPKSARVIFTTAFSDYAVDGFRVHALDYLLKPISYPTFCEAANRALEHFRSIEVSVPLSAEPYGQAPDSLFVKSEYKLIRVFHDEILYIEGFKDYIKIYLEGDKKPIFSLMNMKMLEEKLPTTKFQRLHRSYIVNLSKITLIERGQVVFGDKYLPISDTYKKEIQSYIDRHM